MFNLWLLHVPTQVDTHTHTHTHTHRERAVYPMALRTFYSYQDLCSNSFTIFRVHPNQGVNADTSVVKGKSV